MQQVSYSGRQHHRIKMQVKEDASRTHIWPLLSRARTLILPSFLDFFKGQSRRLDESRSDDAFVAPRGSLIVVVAGTTGGTKHI
jgi:hypothetical protein